MLNMNNNPTPRQICEEIAFNNPDYFVLLDMSSLRGIKLQDYCKEVVRGRITPITSSNRDIVTYPDRPGLSLAGYGAWVAQGSPLNAFRYNEDAHGNEDILVYAETHYELSPLESQILLQSTAPWWANAILISFFSHLKFIGGPINSPVPHGLRAKEVSFERFSMVYPQELKVPEWAEVLCSALETFIGKVPSYDTILPQFRAASSLLTVVAPSLFVMLPDVPINYYAIRRQCMLDTWRGDNNSTNNIYLAQKYGQNRWVVESWMESILTAQSHALEYPFEDASCTRFKGVLLRNGQRLVEVKSPTGCHRGYVPLNWNS